MTRPWIRQEPCEPGYLAPAAENWADTLLGGSLLAAEQQMLDAILPEIFGYRLVQLGISPALQLYAGSDAGHRFAVSPAHPEPPPAAVPGYLCSEVHDLALAGESADILLLHHVLDFDADPHAVLRESARVLISGGTVIVVGFNPWSLFGLRNTLHENAFPWFGAFISPGRLRDWMNLLDLHPQSLEFGYYRPPLDHSGILAGLQWMERAGNRLRLPLGGFYIMTARKHPVGMTPLRPRLTRRRLLVPGMKPTFGDTRLGANRRNLP